MTGVELEKMRDLVITQVEVFSTETCFLILYGRNVFDLNNLPTSLTTVHYYNNLSLLP